MPTQSSLLTDTTECSFSILNVFSVMALYTTMQITVRVAYPYSPEYFTMNTSH